MRSRPLSRLLLLILPTAAVAGIAAEERPPASLAGALLAEANAERVSQGRAALRSVPALNEAAQQRAKEIASGEGDGTLDSEIVDRLARAGYRARKVSEVVMESEGVGDRMLAGWRGSTTYKDLLREDYRDAGVGVMEEDGVQLSVFLFALSARDFFEEESAGLRDLDRLRQELLERVNRNRRENRLPRLGENSRLDRAAQAHADDMARRSYYGHASPEGRRVSDRVAAQGYSPSAAGENLASGQFSVEEVMDGWMKSPTHRENILQRLFTDAGFGVAFGELDGVPTVFWVQVFGRPRG